MTELVSAFAVDSAIMHENRRLVVIVFCESSQSALLNLVHSVWKRMAKYAIFYYLNRVQVPAFNAIYELDRDALMFFFRKRHIEGWFGHKLESVIDSDSMCDLVRHLHDNATRGRTLVE